MFAVVQDRHQPRPNPFGSTRRLTTDTDHPVTSAAFLEIYAPDGNSLQACYDPKSDQAIYLWGRAVHPAGLSGDALLRECARLAEQASPSLRELLGHFVVLIDDRRRGTITFVSDVLGILPWFIGSFNGRLVAGSDVLGICDAGLSSGKIDLDAVSSWLQYNFDCTGGSVVQDYRRLGAASICTYDHSGQLLSTKRYATMSFSGEQMDQHELVDALHTMTSRAFGLLVRDLHELTLPLSGGFDSRYLYALAAEHGGLQLQAVTVESTPQEAMAAQQVADALSMPLQRIATNAHILDLFDEPFAFGADGFPAGVNLTRAVAQLRPGVPILSGYMGDALMRSPLRDAIASFLAQDGQQMSDEQCTFAAHRHCRYAAHRLDLLREPIGQRSHERAMAGMRQVILEGRAAGRPLAFMNLHLRHRLFYALIFLVHRDLCPAVLPFYTWALIDCRARYFTSFQRDNYRLLFARHFPKLEHVPHDSEVKLPNGAQGPAQPDRASRHLRPWSAALLRRIITPHNSTALRPRKLLRRLPRGLLRDPRYQPELTFLHKINLFEKRLRRANLHIDWSEI